MLIYMRMKKRLLIITIALSMIACSALAFSGCGEEQGAPTSNPYPYYTFTKSGATLVLDVSYKSQLPTGAITLPTSSYYYADTEGGEMTRHDTAVPISEIAAGAFEYAGRITSVTVGNSYIKMGERAFYGCTALTSVVLPSDMSAIPDGAFAYCANLKSVTGGATLSSVGAEAFLCSTQMNALDVRWVDNFTVGDSAFFYTVSLRNIDLSKAKTVGSHAFQGWQSGQNITEAADKSGWAEDWRS